MIIHVVIYISYIAVPIFEYMAVVDPEFCMFITPPVPRLRPLVPDEDVSGHREEACYGLLYSNPQKDAEFTVKLRCECSMMFDDTYYLLNIFHHISRFRRLLQSQQRRVDQLTPQLWQFHWENDDETQLVPSLRLSKSQGWFCNGS